MTENKNNKIKRLIKDKSKKEVNEQHPSEQ
jgi:hypothetical protein